MIDGGLRQLWQKHLPQVHWQSVETGLTGRGIPDMNGCYQGVEFWVEDKATPEWWVDLRPEQVGWLERRGRAGGRVFVAIRRFCLAGPRRTAADELWLYDGRQAKALKVEGLRGSTAPLGKWNGGPARWDWPGALRLLSSKLP